MQRKICRCIQFFLCLSLQVFAVNGEFEYIDDVLGTGLDNYEGENIIQHSLIDADINEDDDESDDNGYDLYEDNAKRDLIRGPSFTPKIDDDSASYEIMKENNDINDGDNTKRKIIRKKPSKDKSTLSEVSGESGGESDKEHFAETFMLPEQHKKENNDETSSDLSLDTPHNSTKKHKLSKAEKALVSESLINLLYDWKKHNTPKNSDTDIPDSVRREELEADQVISKLRKASSSLLDKQSIADRPQEQLVMPKVKNISPVVDLPKAVTDEAVSAAIPSGTTEVVTPYASTADVIKPVNSAVTAGQSVDVLPTGYESTANAIKQNKERFNVLVNVNINERAARRSNVDRHVQLQIRRSKLGKANKTLPNYLPAYTGSLLSSPNNKQVNLSPPSINNENMVGALDKLRRFSNTYDEEDDGSTEEDSSGRLESSNNTFSSGMGVTINKPNQTAIADNGLIDNEVEEAESEIDSGSSEGEDNEETTPAKPADMKKTKVVGDFGVYIVNKSNTALKVSVNTAKNTTKNVTEAIPKKKYNPKHAMEEEKQALKGETPADTLEANKIAADREEKDNNMEQNEMTSNTLNKSGETITSKKEDESLTSNKNNTNATIENEVKEEMESVKIGKSKSSEAEDVGIDEVKAPKAPKAIPTEAALESIQSDSKMPTDSKVENSNEELEFTKKQREKETEGQTKKVKVIELDQPTTGANVKKSDNDEKKKDQSDDKYETLAEVREKFKKWENKHQSMTKEPEKAEVKHEDKETATKSDKSEKISPKEIAMSAESDIKTELENEKETANVKEEGRSREEKLKFEKPKEDKPMEEAKLKSDTEAVLKIQGELKSTKEDKVKLGEKVENTDTQSSLKSNDGNNKSISDIAFSDKKPSSEKDDFSSTEKNNQKIGTSKSWKEEEKYLLEKLKSPYLVEHKKSKNDEDDDNVEDEDEKAQKTSKKKDETQEVSGISKKAKAKFLAGVDRLKSKGLKAKLDPESANYVTASIDQELAKVVNKSTVNSSLSSEEISHDSSLPEPSLPEKVSAQNKDSIKALTENRFADEKKNETTEISLKANSQSLKQLQNFKNQILAEVEKINRLEAEYGIEDHSTRDLDEAKDVLNKDLKVVRELEKNLLKKSKDKEKLNVTEGVKSHKLASHRQLLYQPSSPKEVQQLQTAAIKEQEKAEAFDKEIASALQQKAETDVNSIATSNAAGGSDTDTLNSVENNTPSNAENVTPSNTEISTAKPASDVEEEGEVIPETKLGFDMVDEDKKDIKKTEKNVKSSKSKRKSKKTKSKKKNKTKALRKAVHKHHPLTELHSLLKAEIHRLRLPNRGKNDPQLSNIRQLVQQRLKSMLENGDLDKAAVHNLTPDIKELGKLLKKRIKTEKQKRKKEKKNKYRSKNKHSLGSAMMQDYGSSHMSAEEQISTLQTDISNLNGPSVKPIRPNPTDHSASYLPNTTLTSQSTKMKSLLTTLNKKLGEIYSKAQGVQLNTAQKPNDYRVPAVLDQKVSPIVPQPPPKQAHPISPQTALDHPMTPNVTISSFTQPTPNNPEPRPIVIPSTFASNPPATSEKLTPHSSYNQSPLTKGDIHPAEALLAPSKELPPALPQEPDFDETETAGQKALAGDEPVDTLVENLERDITEVWSYRNMFPDAESLGLDNDKVHNTYANLGSLSGLNLRRALNRALRGEDVGLAVVGGSISKGGPFSEKGLDFVLRSYFYAIEDYWNKIIRPVTGSSMIIRDVSIGGIATDYYSYCVQNHLPDDKLTNIVLWELSANDMRRYDDAQRPKPQPLEQFTRNILSYRAKPALIYLNFFALFDWDPDLSAHCRNFEDEGEDDIAKYYKITSLSWRNMVCPLLASGNQPLFTRNKLFAEDNFHPSILAHAQMSYIVIDYIRTEFLKNLVKMRNTNIADAVTRLQIPKTVYVPRPMFPQTYTWKPLCYTYMLVDNRSPNNTLSVDEERNGNFRYTVVREFKIRSDKIVGMETQQKNQYIRYRMHIPRHANGAMTPYKRLGIMSFTDDRSSSIQFDNEQPKEIDTKKTFLEGTVIKYIADNIIPGEHSMTIRSGNNGFLVCAVVLG